jgi:epoxyqueuosine reductase
MVMDYNRLASDIKSWGRELGFAKLGITDVDLSAYSTDIHEWLARGFAGSMDYMARHLDKRLDPTLLLPETVRIISARMDYLPPDTQPLKVLKQSELGYVSRYATGRDYHKLIRKRLTTLARRINDTVIKTDGETSGGGALRAFTDSAPVLEKPLAEKSGLGWIGKHSLLLSREAGSWFFLGEIYTSLPLPVDTVTEEDHCGGCQACQRVCPTAAIIGPRQLDARRCISYLTIENKGPIDVELRPLMGNRIFGCDDCQLICPWNRYAHYTQEADFRPRHGLEARPLLELFSWPEAVFLQKTEGMPLRRINYWQWLRNLSVALGNAPSDAATLQALVEKRAELEQAEADHAPPAWLHEHLDWAIAQQRRER